MAYQYLRTCPGRIFCRLADGSAEIRELGNLICDKSRFGQHPSFGIRECGLTAVDSKTVHGTRHDIPSETLVHMTRQGMFMMHNIQINVSNVLAETEVFLCLSESENYPISGFPRCLYQEKKIIASEY